MKNQKFTKGISGFYDREFNKGEHEICYINDDNCASLLQEDLTIPQREVFFGRNIFQNIVRFYKAVRCCDYIVFHSLFFSWWLRVFLASSRIMYKRIIWIEWGGDLYSWKSRQPLIGNILNYFDRRLRTKCKAVVCIFPPDCDYYSREFPESKAKVFYAPYMSGVVQKEYVNYSEYSRLKESRESNETIYIQIGHSASQMIDHIQTLNMLKRFADRDVKLLLPLNYGDKAYGDKVQAYAENLFPGKVICMREMLPRDEYFDLIKRVDIAIFHTFRQIALGNINRMLFRNVKIYLPENSVMYSYFSGLGVPVQKSEDLCTCSFCELVEDPIKKDEERFAEFIASYTRVEDKIALWKVIYDDLM